MSHNYGITSIPEVMERGLIALTVCSALSLIATSALLIALGVKAFKEYRAESDASSFSRRSFQRVSIHTQGYFWLVNLFIADFVQALGLFTIVHNLVADEVVPGDFCSFQGFMINTGDIASSIWSFIIAVHTFTLLAGGRKYRTWVAEKSMAGKARWVLCALVWAFVVFIGVIGLILIQRVNPQKGPFYDNAGAGWCWIGQDYFWERIFFHYFFLFIDMFALTILYCVLFIYIRVQLKNFRSAASSNTEHNSTQELQSWQANLEAGGPTDVTSPRQIITKTTVTVKSEDRPSINRNRNEADRTHRRMNKVAFSLLCYPITYILLTMPLSITRLSQFAGNNWGLPAIHAAAAIYCCSGFINVMLYTLTRKGIISWDWLLRRRKSTTSGTDNSEPASPTSYVGHYNGGSIHQKPFPRGPISKPSALSLASGDVPSSGNITSMKSNIAHSTESDCESTFDYSGSSDNDKLVHRPGCPQRYIEGASRGSNGSTLVGTCTCRPTRSEMPIYV